MEINLINFKKTLDIFQDFGYNLTMKSIMSVTEFFTTYAPTEERAKEIFRNWRWEDGNPVCPYCECKNVHISTGKQPYRCKSCHKRFTVKTKSILQASNISVQKWLYVIYKMCVSKKGISSIQLAKEIGIAQSTAWYVMQKIRDSYQFKQYLSGIVEVDETYVGGERKNQHANKRRYSGRGIVGKKTVMGLRSRDGEMIGKVVKSNKKNILQGVIHSTVDPDSLVITDDHKSYTGLQYNHKVINHSLRQYVNGIIHTNGIESIWAILKRAYMGTYHHMSFKHLQRYVNEIAFRINTSKLSVEDFIGFTCINMNDKIVTRKDIIA